MKQLIFALLCFALFANFQCEKVDNDQIFKLGEPFTYQFGDFYVENNGGPLSIQFNNVVSDSRCPTSVICVWEGEVSVEMKYFANNAVQTDTLSLGGLNADPTMDSSLFQGYTIKLTKVDPYPETTVEIPLDSYKLTLVVTKQ